MSGRDALQLYFERYMFWEIYNSQRLQTGSGLTTGMSLFRWNLEVLESYLCFTAMLRYPPKAVDLCSSGHNLCHVQGSLRACTCHLFLEIPVLPSFWWCACLLSLVSSLLSSLGIMSASPTFSGHWVKACLACAKLSFVTDSVNISRKLFPDWGRWLWFG